MARTSILGGATLTTTLQTIVTNASADAKTRVVELRFSNIDGVNPADITQCILIDSSASNAQRPVMGVNTTVRARETLSTNVTLDPGDSIQSAASAGGDIYLLVTKIHEEAA
ncbi:hypothetical protein ACLNGM_15140 [Aureimonas phyllosphaerae]|uniref:hypothetical protein n=1 Tax=Aureimonas phyllosphaerae TaxID=1166078 RepID=UPI003A5BB047